MLKSLLARWLQARRKQGFAAFRARCHDVRAAQEALLLRLVARNGMTALARRLGVPAVRSLEDLRRLPITDYDAIAPELTAALNGAADQLVAGRPDFYGMTSGTTQRSKYIPIDEAYRAEFQSTVQHFLYGIVRDHPRALAHKALYLVGPAAIERTPGGAVAGSISGHNLRRLPALLRMFYAVPAEAFEIADSARQAYVVARFALAAELSIAFAVTTAALALVGAAIETHAEALLRDIHDGTLEVPGLPLPLHASLTRALRPDPERARLLARRAAGPRRATPEHFFPELALISCWHHASAGSHLARMRELWGSRVPIRPAIYSATEAWMNIPLADARPGLSPGGVLAADAVVLEFLDASGKARFAHELREPGRYEVLVTSGAGLWRYRLGDEVEVTGFFEQPAAAPGAGRHAPELCYVQKTGSVVSLTHDMTTEAHITTAVAAALPAARRWVLGPSPAAPDRYRVVAEQIGEEPAGEPLARQLDRALGHANRGYELDREAGFIQELELVFRSSDEFDRWEASRRTVVLAQAKPTVLVKSAAELPP